MAKILRLRKLPLPRLQSRKRVLLNRLLQPPQNVLRASSVEQYLTCGKERCRCRNGHKHGPFRYLVQCLKVGVVQKFLLKGRDQQQTAKAGIAAYAAFQGQLEELSQINTELLRRGKL